MFKYLISGDYTVEGTKGLIKDGGTGRKAAIEKMAASLDGSLESFHFAAALPRYHVILNLPNKLAATAAGAAIVAAGGVTINECVELLTPAEMDEAMKKSPAYRAPGH
jgi:uncharacterized protein with GYD domain